MFNRLTSKQIPARERETIWKEYKGILSRNRIFRLLAAAGSIISLKLLLSCSHLFQFLLKLESAISQIVRQSSSLHEAVIVVVEQSSGSHQVFIRQSS